MTEVERINIWLKEYGPKSVIEEPLFQLVWSDTQTEYRKGTFSDFSGDIFLRTVTEVRLVKKYNYIQERWVLEMWVPPSITSREELPDSFKGTYEPVYVFEDKKGNYLAPNLKVIQFLIKYAQQAPKLTPAERLNEFNENERKGMLELMDREIDTISDVGLALRTGSGVGYSKHVKGQK